MVASYLRHRIAFLVLHTSVDRNYLSKNTDRWSSAVGEEETRAEIRRSAYHRRRIVGESLLTLHLALDRLADRQLAGALADLRQVGAAETLRRFGKEVQVDVLNEADLHTANVEETSPI